MQVGGLFLLVFVVFHILHFTTGTIDSERRSPQGAVYDNLTEAFQQPALRRDLRRRGRRARLPPRHAVWSFFQTGGWDKPNRNPTFRRLATSIAVGVGGRLHGGAARVLDGGPIG